MLFRSPVSLFFIALGLLFGSILSDKQAGGICGALLTNLTAFLSGAWIDVSLIGDWFAALANVFPFIHATDLMRAAISGNFESAASDALVLFAWLILSSALAVAFFLRSMKKCSR